MTKSHNTKKGTKKEAVRTLKEKRAAKREKKLGPSHQSFLELPKK